MDVSVVAAVGSFFMSERVLKPKATLLVILGCLLTYDLTTKTHDVASLRVYRGKMERISGRPAYSSHTHLLTAFCSYSCRENEHKIRASIARIHIDDGGVLVTDVETQRSRL